LGRRLRSRDHQFSSNYDNLVGKLRRLGGRTRAPRHRMLRAMGELHIEGIHTTVLRPNCVLDTRTSPPGPIPPLGGEEVDLSGLVSDSRHLGHCTGRGHSHRR